MKHRILALGFVILNLILGECSVVADSGRSLQECYVAALATSEALKRRADDVVVAEARYQKALAAIYPQLSLALSQRYRNSSSFGQVSRGGASSAVDGGDPNTTFRSGSLGKNQFEGVFTISQPIFNGFRDLYAARALAATKDAAVLDLTRERELLYSAVADLFFQVGMYQADRGVLQRTVQVLEQRIAELQNFVKLGKSRESEILAAQSDLEAARVAHAQVDGLLDETRELLSFLIGVPANELRIAPTGSTPPLAPMTEYLTRSTARSDLTAVRRRHDAALLERTVRARASWPALRAEGNGYAVEDPDRNRDWDVLLRLDVPLYTAGRIDADVAEADAVARQYALVASERSREIERDVRRAYAKVTSARRERVQATRLRDTATRNLTVQRKDYSDGVVTNLEVLSAIRRVQDAERQLLAIDAALGRATAELEVAAGGILP